MTVRQYKRFVLVIGALVLVGGALNLWNAFGPGGEGWKDFTGVLPLAFFGIYLSTMWTGLARQEAEHGPDYIRPKSHHNSLALAVAGLLAVILVALTVFLLVRNG